MKRRELWDGRGWGRDVPNDGVLRDVPGPRRANRCACRSSDERHASIPFWFFVALHNEVVQWTDA